MGIYYKGEEVGFIVNSPATGTLDITENGVYDVKNKAKVDVKVSSKLQALMNDLDLNITLQDLDNVTEIADYAFYRRGNLKSIEIPTSVTKIGKQAFYYCNDLYRIDFPDSIETLGEQVCYGCGSMYYVTLPKNLTRIESGSFCTTSLQEVIIPEGVTYIGSSAFYISSLSTVTIPAGVTTIGQMAFGNNNKLVEMILLPTTPPSIALNTISTATTIIYVPYGTKTLYETTNVWKDLLTRETNPITFIELNEDGSKPNPDPSDIGQDTPGMDLGDDMLE